MNEQQLNAIAQFMQRIDLKPAEIPVWQECMQALGKAVETNRAKAQQQQPNPFQKAAAEPE